MSSTWRIIWTLAVALAVGCSPDPLEAPRGEPVPLEAELPVVDPGVLEEPWEALQIEVTKDAIRLSHERQCRQWQRVFVEQLEERAKQQSWSERFADDYPGSIRQKFIEVCGTSAQETVTKVVALDDGRIDTGKERMIERVYDELVAVTHQKQRFDQLAKLPYRPQLLVAADKDIAIEALFKVLYTAGRAEMSLFGFLVEPGDPPKMLRFDTPWDWSSCADPCACGGPPHVPDCADVSVQMTDDGLFAHLVANHHALTAVVETEEHYVSSACGYQPDSEWVDADGEPVRWHDTSLGDGCTSVARTEDGYDIEALAELLDDFDEVEYCGQADLRVHRSASSITSGDLMQAASAIRTLERFEVVFGPGYTERDIDSEAPAGEGLNAEGAEDAKR